MLCSDRTHPLGCRSRLALERQEGEPPYCYEHLLQWRRIESLKPIKAPKREPDPPIEPPEPEYGSREWLVQQIREAETLEELKEALLSYF